MYSKRFEKEAFKEEVKNNIKNLYRKTIEEATGRQIFQAVSLAVKETVIDYWLATQAEMEKKDPKTVYYMSMEFLMGRALGNNLINMTAYQEVKEALDEMGIDLNIVEDQEPDAALGNGGLGRLAACFLDSLATLGYPAYGCGIRYRYGMFKQKIENGYQVEVPDNWLKDGNPFEIRRDEYAKEVRFGGDVRIEYDPLTKRNNFIQENYSSVRAVPYDMPIIGYGNHVVNTLRIWDAEAITDFHLDAFNRGDYRHAVEQENLAKMIVDVLYPCDDHYAGKELRLKQQYFFISASLQALLVRYKKKHDDVRKLHEKVTIQMNDTHPTLAVAELMHLLIDQEGLEWDEAWDVTTKTVAYTNHTIMAEALEKWPIDLFSKLLPRIYQIIQEIDRRFIEQIRVRFPGDEGRVARMAIIRDGQVKMAHLAIVAGYSVNGVARLHTEILKHEELKDFVDEMEFDRLGVFTYSPEEDTPAATMTEQIPEEVKEDRQAELMELQQEIAFDLAEDMVGREVLVMIEGKVADENAYVGRTYKDAPNVDGLIFINTDEELMSGDFARVRVTGALEYDLIGELI